MLFAAAVAAAVLAADRTDPVAFFAAEGQVAAAKVQVPGPDLVVWTEVTFRVKRCIAGHCTPGSAEKVLVPTSMWKGKQGDVMGLVRWAWQDGKGKPRTWSMALSLNDEEQKDRFNRETEVAVAGSETPISGTAVAVMKRDAPGGEADEKAPVAKR